ncbi:hypothetical protein ACTZWW_04345 [Salinarimonas sp. NSM]|uniref:hypothetical protein n=1 Tax=Salinarimonas sp. NSM TaxID=3458003 RepID=UPI0040367AB5
MPEPTTRERAILAVDALWPSDRSGAQESFHSRAVAMAEKLIRDEREACTRVLDGAGAFPAFQNLAAAIRSRR